MCSFHSEYQNQNLKRVRNRPGSVPTEWPHCIYCFDELKTTINGKSTPFWIRNMYSFSRFIAIASEWIIECSMQRRGCFHGEIISKVETLPLSGCKHGGYKHGVALLLALLLAGGFQLVTPHSAPLGVRNHPVIVVFCFCSFKAFFTRPSFFKGLFHKAFTLLTSEGEPILSKVVLL